MTETTVKFEVQAKIAALRAKEKEFKTAGDYGRATHAKIVADFLADFLQESGN